MSSDFIANTLISLNIGERYYIKEFTKTETTPFPHEGEKSPLRLIEGVARLHYAKEGISADDIKSWNNDSYFTQKIFVETYKDSIPRPSVYIVNKTQEGEHLFLGRINK